VTVVIPCAGTGSRLGFETKYINKAMVTVSERPVFSYIINNFTEDDEIIILLGYKGEYLKAAIEACYPNYNIKFVEVDKFEGEDSGLGYSLSKARNLLQTPFLFWACDTVLLNSENGIRQLINTNSEDNLLFLSDILPEEIGLYRGVEEGTNRLIDKGLVTKDNYKSVQAYTGVAYIKDYEKFWNIADSNLPEFIRTGESLPLSKMEFKTCNIYSNDYDWYDIGSLKGLERLRETLKSTDKVIMPKQKEAIWFINGDVIKFHIDKDFISKRVSRSKNLLSPGMVRSGIKYPEVVRCNDYTYCYKEYVGSTLSEDLTPSVFSRLVDSYFVKSLTRYDYCEPEFKEKFCKEFYFKKTKARINEYLSNHKWFPIINDRCCVNPLRNLEDLDIHTLTENMIPTLYCHGDFHLENILYSNEKEFILLDWRQGFFGSYVIGDANYDLSKLLHSLIVNHRYVRSGEFKFEVKSENSCRIDIRQSEIYSECRDILRKACKKIGVEYSFIELMTALIFLNIAVCHDGDGVYPEFLFHLGAYLFDVYMEEYHG